MAAKRTSNVSSIYSFSEDSACSDEDVDLNRKILNSSKRTRFQSSVRERNSKVRRLQHISSSCDENTNSNEPEHYVRNSKESSNYKKQACNSKNAIMARENRLKKKLYLDSLEGQISSLKTQNRKMRVSLGTQSTYITDLESELNYLRNILANTKEISLLLKSVHGNTGLPVSTSLQNYCNNNNKSDVIIPTRSRVPVARKTAWPYEDTHQNDVNIAGSIPTPPTSISSASPAHVDVEPPMSPFNLDVTSYFSDDDDDLPIALKDVGLSPYMSMDELISDQLESIPEQAAEPYQTLADNTQAIMDHNYSSKLSTETLTTPSHFGVCLHISNKKVSLEFCSKCNSNAVANWEPVKY